MDAVPRSEYYCSVSAEKAYTSFEWCLNDWTLLSERYLKNFESPRFMLNGLGECLLRLNAPYNSSSACIINVIISKNVYSQNERGIHVSVSFISENLEKLITVEEIDQRCIHEVLSITVGNRQNRIAQYLRNNTLRVLCEITVIGEIKKSSLNTSFRTESSIDVYNKFNAEIYKTKKLYDVTFVIEGRKLFAHKLILAAHSNVFEAMFTAPMIEQKQGVVNIIDAKFTVFDGFIEYMYTGKVSMLENSVEDLIFLADKYQVNSLKQVCEHFMLNNLCNETAVKYLSIADKFSCEELKQKASKYVKVN